MNAPAARQRVEIRRQRGNERLTLPRSHFGNLALMQDDAADQLHIEMAHSGRTHARFSDDSKSFRQDLIERFLFAALALIQISYIGDSALQLLLKLRSAGAQLFVRQLFYSRLKFVDLLNNRLD